METTCFSLSPHDTHTLFQSLTQQTKGFRVQEQGDGGAAGEHEEGLGEPLGQRLANHALTLNLTSGQPCSNPEPNLWPSMHYP